MSQIQNTSKSQKDHLNNIVTDFKLDFESLNSFLRKYNGMIAGGMSTFSFCELTGNFDGDMDIWIQVRPNFFSEGTLNSCSEAFKYSLNPEREVLNKKYYDLNTTCPFKDQIISDFLEVVKGYSDSVAQAHGTYKYRINPMFETNIYKMFQYSYNDKKIQLFLTYLSNYETLKLFDRSCCANSWNGDEFYSLEPSLTLQKLYYFMPSYEVLTHDQKERRDFKYLKRGFKMIERPEYELNSS